MSKPILHKSSYQLPYGCRRLGNILRPPKGYYLRLGPWYAMSGVRLLNMPSGYTARDIRLDRQR